MIIKYQTNSNYKGVWGGRGIRRIISVREDKKYVHVTLFIFCLHQKPPPKHFSYKYVTKPWFCTWGEGGRGPPAANLLRHNVSGKGMKRKRRV